MAEWSNPYYVECRFFCSLTLMFRIVIACAGLLVTNAMKPSMESSSEPSIEPPALKRGKSVPLAEAVAAPLSGAAAAVLSEVREHVLVPYRHVIVFTDPLEEIDDETAVSYLINVARVPANTFFHVVCVGGDKPSRDRLDRLASVLQGDRPRNKFELLAIEEFMASAEEHRFASHGSRTLILQIAPMYAIPEVSDAVAMAHRIVASAGSYDYVLLGALGATKNSQNVAVSPQATEAAVKLEKSAVNSWVIDSTKVGAFTPRMIPTFSGQLQYELLAYFFKYSHGLAAARPFLVHLMGAPNGPKYVGTKTYFDIVYGVGQFDQLDVNAEASWVGYEGRMNFLDYATHVYLKPLEGKFEASEPMEEILRAKRDALGQTAESQRTGLARMLAAQYVLSKRVEPIFIGSEHGVRARGYASKPVEIYQSNDLRVLAFLDSGIVTSNGRVSAELTGRFQAFVDKMNRAAIDDDTADLPMSPAYDLAAAVFASNLLRGEIGAAKALTPQGVYQQTAFSGTAEAIEEFKAARK